ncbi:MAG: flagellar hook-associated protein FlgK [Candidatus Kapaibacteriales bacterium]
MAFSGLEIAKRALLAQRFGLDVTSNNIANANTAGYSRRSATYSEATPFNSQGNFVGTGVMVDKLRTYREEFFDREIRDSQSRKSALETDDKIYNQIAGIIGEPSDFGITETVVDFFNAFSELSVKPDSIGLRQNLITKTQIMTDRFNTVSQKLSSTREEVLSDIYSSVDKVNELSSQIAELNSAFASGKRLTLEEAQTAADQRELKLEELSQLTATKVTQNDNGSVNVFLNGINIVTGAFASEIKLVDEVNGEERNLRLLKIDGNGNTLNAIKPESGELERLIYHYNNTLDPNENSEFSPSSMLNSFAEATIEKVNSLTRSGYGLDDPDNGGAGSQRTFFDESEGNTNAINFQINKELIDDPRSIPLSSAATESGNGNIATSIAFLQNDTDYIDLVSPVEYFSGLVGELSAKANQSRNALATSKIVTEQLNNQREAIIGVNLDEEAVNLIKFQQAFEASSRMVTATNEILSTIINLGR